jgi:hypothetical protein
VSQILKSDQRRRATQTGERSFTVQRRRSKACPFQISFVQLASLARRRHRQQPTRLGGGGANNVMMDGISTMDTAATRCFSR